ncbi:type IV toxin-antitoxin system AbiEi family antitoxin domain-containing protein [Actinotalea solisilvae]|uniref:type IV toxin-antitoxin system AbiEi family antitoxin domain-containing protein n=1 Tax=Actinotalea solisilvae TaxID=2072922 RepID=UPI0018F1D9C4|nr:type IV toxin-antitoxin system AbiEi family antitoxin domain-containing protein [Actinotalea solisilvae]
MARIPGSVLRLAARQNDAITVAQADRLGLTKHRVARLVAAGHWQRLHRGVVVVHSGPLPWLTRARAGLLYAGPGAALSHASAGYLHRFLRAEPSLVDVSVPAHRRVMRSDGLVVHLRRAMPSTTAGIVSVGRADTVVDLVASRGDVDEAVSVVCAAVRAGTRPDEILAALSARPAVGRRRLLEELLGAVRDGVESALELRYQRDVERRHGLPRSRAQARRVVGGRWTRADRRYDDVGLTVELDGEVAHPGGRTDDDVWRDNAVLLSFGDLTLRYRWRHVLRPCATAVQVGVALRRLGWRGSPRPCGPTCSVAPR